MVKKTPTIKVSSIKTTEALLDFSNDACFPIIILDLRSQKHFSSNENIGTKMVLSKLPCSKVMLWTSKRETENTALVTLKGKCVQCTITP